MVRRWKHANRILAEWKREHRAAGIADPRWHEDPLIVMALLMASTLVVVAGVAALLDAVGAITFGIIIVVGLGTSGQVLHGVAEKRKGDTLKAWGCYLSGAAYVAVATVALANGVPRLLAGS